MDKKEKVIKGLECCVIHVNCAVNGGCPYNSQANKNCLNIAIKDAIALLKAQEPITGETSDGYHTFNELYHHRAVLFSVIVANYKDRAWKSVRHHDGTMYDGMFIVGIDTPDGQATYHYDIDPYWDMFDCKVREFAPEWDGHTPAQAIERIGKLKAREPKWTPITFRALTEEEKEEHPDWCYIIDSPTPDDGEDILVSDGKKVWADVWGNNGTECYLESDHELEGVAWMKMPTPWRKEANT